MVDEAVFLAESQKPTSGEEYIAKLEQFKEYIDRAREMHPYATAAFYELLIDFCEDTIKGMGWDKPARAAAPPPPEAPEPHHEPRHAAHPSRAKR